MALMTLSLVLPPVLELISVQAENEGITKLGSVSAASGGAGIEMAYMAVSQ